VLFRPEEVHEASSSGYIFPPAREGDVNVAYDGGRRGLEDLTIPHVHPNRLVAVQARAVDLDLLAGV
jgi:hypothetical protein